MENQSPAQSSGQIYPPQNQPVAPQPPVQPVNSSSVPPPTQSQGLPPYVPSSNKKRIFVIVGAIIALLVIIAIVAIVILSMSNKKNQGDVTLTYWGLWEDESVYKEVIDEFERQNPHIKVKYEKQDTRAIIDKTGKAIFFYAFLGEKKDLLIITTKESTLKEVLNRLTAVKKI
jgi:hypothetical protein